MKSRPVWWLIAAVLVAAVVIMVWPQKAESRPQVELSFLGYSNLPAGPAVAFAMHLPPRFGGCLWSGMAVDSLEGGVWKATSEPKRMPMQCAQINIAPARATNGRPFNSIMILPVDNTYEVWRFRFWVEEMPPEPPFFVRLGRDLWRRMQRPVKRVDFESRYWLTNEVRPPAPPKP